MPDIRLRPATQAPSDIAIGPATDSRADVILRPAPGSDIGLHANVRPTSSAPAAPPPSSFTLAGAMTQAPATITGELLATHLLATWVRPRRAIEEDELVVFLVASGML